MKITVFNGSPRAEKGNTHFMVEAFSEGAIEAGAEVENIFLVKKNIKPCLGCFDCWIKTPGRCIFSDGMDELLPKFTDSDIVVFATPLYIGNVTGIMKIFMDRTIPTATPRLEKDPAGEYRHVRRHARSPKVVVISNCGFPEQSHFQVLRLVFKRLAWLMHSEVIAEIYRGGGTILTLDRPALRAPVERYRQLLRKAGREVVANRRLSDETAARLEEPLIPRDQYAQGYL